MDEPERKKLKEDEEPRWHRGPSGPRPSADSYCLWSTNGTVGCTVCAKKGTPCDACLFFLPRLTRKLLLYRCGRKPSTHLMDSDGEKCLLCGTEDPQNQHCYGNIWDEEGELSTYKDGWCQLTTEIEDRWAVLVATGKDSERERKLMNLELYGHEDGDLAARNLLGQNTELMGECFKDKVCNSFKHKTENLRQPEITEVLGTPEERERIKKAAVSKQFLPRRSASSAEVEQWVLLSAQHVELEPGQALVVKSMTWIRKQNFPAPHVTRIVALSPGHWLGQPVDAVLGVKSGVVNEGFFGQLSVSVYNKGPRTVVIRRGAMLGSVVRENYLLGPSNTEDSDCAEDTK